MKRWHHRRKILTTNTNFKTSQISCSRFAVLPTSSAIGRKKFEEWTMAWKIAQRRIVPHCLASQTFHKVSLQCSFTEETPVAERPLTDEINAFSDEPYNPDERRKISKAFFLSRSADDDPKTHTSPENYWNLAHRKVWGRWWLDASFYDFDASIYDFDASFYKLMTRLFMTAHQHVTTPAIWKDPATTIRKLIKIRKNIEILPTETFASF